MTQLTLASAPLVYEKLLPNVRTLRLKLNVVWVGHAEGEQSNTTGLSPRNGPPTSDWQRPAAVRWIAGKSQISQLIQTATTALFNCGLRDVTKERRMNLENELNKSELSDDCYFLQNY